MALVAGASRFLSASTLANTRGTAPSIPTLLSQESTTASILDAARGTLAVRGLGISSSARALNQAFLSRTSDINQMFSLGIGSDATIEGLAQQIRALRSSLPDSRLARSLRGADADAGIPPSIRGKEVDKKV